MTPLEQKYTIPQELFELIDEGIQNFPLHYRGDIMLHMQRFGNLFHLQFRHGTGNILWELQFIPSDAPRIGSWADLRKDKR